MTLVAFVGVISSFDNNRCTCTYRNSFIFNVVLNEDTNKHYIIIIIINVLHTRSVFIYSIALYLRSTFTSCY